MIHHLSIYLPPIYHVQNFVMLSTFCEHPYQQSSLNEMSTHLRQHLISTARVRIGPYSAVNVHVSQAYRKDIAGAYPFRFDPRDMLIFISKLTLALLRLQQGLHNYPYEKDFQQQSYRKFTASLLQRKRSRQKDLRLRKTSRLAANFW